jgi:hypothetical protein
MSTIIDDLRNTPIPPKLWHYTSIQAFQAIVTSKSIWATDLRFLNDRQEFLHTRSIAEEIVATAPDLDENGFPNKSYLEKGTELVFKLEALRRAQVFVASFSEAEDQLGQWRGYSQGSSGVSLAFELSSFRPPPKIETAVSFAPCVYDAEVKNQLVMDALHHFRDEVGGYRQRVYKDALKRNPEKGALANKEKVVLDYLEANPSEKDPSSKLNAAVTKTGYDFLRISSLLKHSSFKEENEWRLVLPTLIDDTKTANNPPQFRVGRTSLVPYIAYAFKSVPLPLVDVILGPGSDENSLFAAQRFLTSQGIGLKPRLSSVPYRAL